MKKTVQRSDRAQRGMGPAVVQQLRSRLAGQPGGQTLLEFALVAPLLIFFILALVDFGIAIDRRIVLDHAVREGARYASVGGSALADGAPSTEPMVVAYTMAQGQGIPDSVEVCYAGEEEVRVTVRYVHDFVTGFTSIFDPGFANINMDAVASARVEQLLDGVGDCPPPEVPAGA